MPPSEAATAATAGCIQPPRAEALAPKARELKVSRASRGQSSDEAEQDWSSAADFSRRRRLSTKALISWWPLLLLVLLSFVTRTDQRLVVVNEGANVTLACGEGTSSELATWVLPNRANISGTLVLQQTGDLLIVAAVPAAAGVYTCTSDSDDASRLGSRVELRVRTVPGPVTNVTITPHSVYATVSWSFSSSPDLVPEGFLCQYRQEVVNRDRLFLNTSSHLGPDTRTCDLYDLTPATTYYVKVAAFNELGLGEFVSTVFTTSNRSQACSHSASSFFIPEYGRLLGITLSSSLLALALLAAGLVLLLWNRNKRARPLSPLHEELADEESLELVPHITLNPSFNIEMLEHISPDYNESSEHAFLVAISSGASTNSRQQGAER